MNQGGTSYFLEITFFILNQNSFLLFLSRKPDCSNALLTAHHVQNFVVITLLWLSWAQNKWCAIEIELLMQTHWCNGSQVGIGKSHLRDDVIKWKHFPCYWPFVRGIHQSPVNFPHKGQSLGALMFSLMCAWINGWVNNREAAQIAKFMGPTWVLSAPGGPHVSPMNIAIRVVNWNAMAPIKMSGTHFTKDVWAHDWNLVKILFDMIRTWKFQSLRSEICTCADSSAVVPFAKLWPDQIIIIKKVHQDLVKNCGNQMIQIQLQQIMISTG